MEKVVPWRRLVGVIEPHYPKSERGRPPVGIERMLRLYFLQQWYGLADEALEDICLILPCLAAMCHWMDCLRLVISSLLSTPR